MVVRHPKFRTPWLIDDLSVRLTVVDCRTGRASHKKTFRNDFPFAVPSVNLVQVLCPLTTGIHARSVPDGRNDLSVEPFRTSFGLFIDLH